MGVTNKRFSNAFFLKSLSQESISLYQVTSDNPQKDNFHNLTFGIDKRTIFDTFNPTILIKLSFSKRG
jgi:hypothetical protein